MRTQQMQLLKKAKASNMSEQQINALSREEIPIPILMCAYDYILLHNMQNVETFETAQEVNKWFDFMIMQNQSKKITTKQWTVVMSKLLPHSYVIKDTLIGSDEKLRLWTAYKFAQSCIERHQNLNKNKVYTTLIIYSYLLYSNVDHKKIKSLIKTVALGHADAHKLLYAFAGYPMLADDYNHNYQESLIWKLIKSNSLDNFMLDPEILANSYDYYSHRFTENILADFE